MSTNSSAPCWVIYPALYFNNTLNVLSFLPRGSNTWGKDGATYNITRILNAD
jgi:hypothetical protein